MQLNIFEMMRERYKITKPIRLNELFAGIGSQAKALQNLNANFEHYKVVEFDKYAIASYNAIHGTSFETSDITQISADDLQIVETDKYEYIMTYSFPCQDLSLAGKQRGMAKGDSTRSGLLWEVERLLKECKELPQVLLMENVPDVIGTRNVEDFNKWQLFLEKLGYRNYHELLNAKDYGIPQNRNRCFMVSVLGNYSYNFPQPTELKLRLKDMLEDDVDEKFYLSQKQLKQINNWNSFQNPLDNVLGKNSVSPTITTRVAETDAGGISASMIVYSNELDKTKNIRIPEATKQGYAEAEAEDGDGVYLDRPHQKRGVVQKGMIQTLKTSGNDVGVVVKVGETGKHQKDGIYDIDGLSPTIVATSYKQPTQIVVTKDTENYIEWYEKGKFDSDCRAFKEDKISAIITTSGKEKVSENSLRIRKLTPRETYRLMGFDDEDFDKASKVNSNSQLYKQAGNSIVVNVLEAIFKELL